MHFEHVKMTMKNNSKIRISIHSDLEKPRSKKYNFRFSLFA